MDPITVLLLTTLIVFVFLSIIRITTHHPFKPKVTAELSYGALLMYIYLSDEKVHYTKEVCTGINVDYAFDGSIIGVEVIRNDVGDEVELPL